MPVVISAAAPEPDDSSVSRMTRDPLEPFITLREAAEFTKLSERTLRRAIRAGRLPSGGYGRRIRLKRSDLVALVSGKQRGKDSGVEALDQHIADQTAANPKPGLASAPPIKKPNATPKRIGNTPNKKNKPT
jgi:excisionase family DNA binding protein